MPYATTADLIARYGEEELIQQTDRLGTGLADPVPVARALADASAVIDGYLRSRYTLPLATVPELLVGLCCDIARYALYPDAVPETVQKRRDDAIAMLRDIGAGRARLEEETPQAPSVQGLVEFSCSPRVFARGPR